MIKLVPFRPEFRYRLLTDEKTATTRMTRLGEVGDQFMAFGALFELTKVFETNIRTVAERLYREEGFETPMAFLRVWGEIHPRRIYDPSLPVVYHEFKRIDVVKD